MNESVSRKDSEGDDKSINCHMGNLVASSMLSADNIRFEATGSYNHMGLCAPKLHR